MTDDLIERLQGAAEAYPEDVFGKTTDKDRLAHGDVVQRAAATMGRHMAPLLHEAAAALEAAREDAARLDWLATDGCIEGFVGVEYDIYDYACGVAEESGREEPNGSDMLGGLRRLVDAAIDAAREVRND